MFGQSKPLFGGATSTAFGFGPSSFTTTAQPTTGLFGQPTTPTTLQSMFSLSAFGSTPSTTTAKGTWIAFNPPISTDAVQRGGQRLQVNAKHMCIAAMKEYQDKSLEELRLEDYALNKKGGSASLFGGGLKPSIFSTTTTSAPFFGSTTVSSQSNSFFGGGSSLFGNAFGQTTQTSLFAAKPILGTSTTPFASGLTSTPQPQLGSIFGQSAQTQGSLFGSKPAFGVTTTTAPLSFGMFGGQPTQTSQPIGSAFGFSAKSPSTGLFGSNPTDSNLFGASQTIAQPSPFGVVATQSTGIFGGIKPTMASPLFASTTTSSAFGFGSVFGAKPSTASTGLFGNTLTSNPLAPKPTGFGFPSTQTNTPFGLTPASTTQTPFGGSLFGAATTTTAGAGFSFATGSPSTGLFGGTFGAAVPASQTTTGLFGGSGFGAATAGNLFGAQSQASPFGATGLKQPGSGFGFSALGQTSQPLFGAVPSLASGSGLFGGGLAATGGTFGFGGGQMTSLGTGNVANSAATFGPLLEQLNQNARAQQHVLDLVRSMPYGQSALFRHLGVTSASNETQSNLSTTQSKVTNSSVLSGQAITNTLAERHKAAGMMVGSPLRSSHSISRCYRRPPLQQLPINRSQLFSGLSEEDAAFSINSPSFDDPISGRSSSASDRFFVRRDAWKSLNISDKVRNSTIERSAVVLSELSRSSDTSLPPVSSAKPNNLFFGGDVGLGDNSSNKIPAAAGVQPCGSERVTPLQIRRSDRLSSADEEITKSSATSHKAVPAPIDVSSINQIFTPPLSKRFLPPQKHSIDQEKLSPEKDLDTTWSLPPDATLGETMLADATDETVNDFDSASVAGVKLTKPGYYIFPTLEELHELVEDGRCVVQDLIVGRQSYGHILFPGFTDITGVDFDDVVHIRRREVVVYSDDATKPPVGYGLNRKAEVTLDGIWPTDKSTREFIKSSERLAAIHFDERLEKATQKMDAKFIEYRPETGSWVFEVKHFSKYRLDDSDEESECTTGTDFQSKMPTSNQKVSESVLVPRNDFSAPLFKTEDCNRNIFRNQNSADSEKFTSKDSEHFSNSTSLWTSQTFPTTFRNVKDSLFLDEFHCLNNNLEEKEALENGYFFPNQRVNNSHIAKNSPFPKKIKPSPDAVPNGKISSVMNDSIEKNSMEFFGKNVFPSVKTEPILGIHNPASYIHSANINKSSRILRTNEIRFSSAVPYKEIGALLGSLSSSAASTKLSQLFFDAGLSMTVGFQISFAFTRYSGRHEHLLISPHVLDNQLLGLGASSVTQCSEKLEKYVVFTNISSDFDVEEELLLNTALQTSFQSTSPDSLDISTCPQFQPNAGLQVLESHLSTIDNDYSSKSSVRMLAFHRAVTMCQALWGRHVSEELEETNFISSGIYGKPRNENNASAFEMDFADSKAYTDPQIRSSADFSLSLLARKQAVSEWIRDQLRPWLLLRLKELNLSSLLNIDDQSVGVKFVSNEFLSSLLSLGSKIPTNNIVDGIFSCLICGESELAFRLGLAGKLPSFSTILSQASAGDPLYKLGIRRQIELWHSLQIDKFIPKSILFSYALLAGQIHIPAPSGSATENVLDVLTGCNYLQALGVHLWYLTDYTADLEDVIKLFSRNWHSFFSTAVSPPCPPSKSELIVTSANVFVPTILNCNKLEEKNVLNSREWPRDVSYHLLKLKCRKWHKLERTLDPTCIIRRDDFFLDGNHSALTDWSSSWHLWRILYSLGLRHLNPIATSRLHTQFASQLEACGLWEWAIFVYMHESDPTTRHACVKQVLTRHVSLHTPLTGDGGVFRIDPDSVTFYTRPEKFLLNIIKLPVRWFHEAKACLARTRLAQTPTSSTFYDKRRLLASLECAHWFAAGHFESAHSVCVKNLLPNMVLHSDCTHFSNELCKANLKNLLSLKLLTTLQPFAQLPLEKLPSSYETGAHVYLTYGRVLRLISRLSTIAESKDEFATSEESSISEPLGETLYSLQEAAKKLCDLIQEMPTLTVLDRVVKSEIALSAIGLMSAFLQSTCSNLRQIEYSPDMETAVSTDKPDISETLSNYASLISRIGLPSEAVLRELRLVSALEVEQSSS